MSQKAKENRARGWSKGIEPGGRGTGATGRRGTGTHPVGAFGQWIDALSELTGRWLDYDSRR